MDAIAKPTLAEKMFCKEALAHDIFVMKAVKIFALVKKPNYYMHLQTNTNTQQNLYRSNCTR